MNQTLKISTQSVKKVKSVEIDGIPFKVRRFGAGEQLTVMQLQRKVDFYTKVKDLTPEQEDDMIKISRSLLDIVGGIFEDMKDGEETKKLIERIDLEDIQLLLNQIFLEDTGDES